MNLTEAYQRIAGRLADRTTDDIAVDVAAVGDERVSVTIRDCTPLLYYVQWVDLLADGTVREPEPDDGCTSPGAPALTVGTVAGLDEAVELVVARVDMVIDFLVGKQTSAAASALPKEQPPFAEADLAVACEMWQGGRDRVLSQEQRGGTTHVRLRWFGASGDQVGSDDVLLGVLGAAPGVTDSSLTRSAGSEELKLRLEGYGNSATVVRRPGADDVQVTRYWPPDPGWDRLDDSPYSQYLGILKASRRSTVPADVDGVVAEINRPRA